MTKQSRSIANESGKVTVGNRFRLTRDVDRFPDFMARAGLTGTVTITKGGVWAKMDQHIPGAEEWDNQLYWETASEFGLDTEDMQ
jgi:hypothetical protein